jgi:Uncharacterized conserved protein
MPVVTGGTYTLLVDVDSATRLRFGAAGDRELSAGTYAYVGSALGTGGFARVKRHRELARGERDARHWHVDYLLGAPEASVVDDIRTAGDVECAVATALHDRDGTNPVPGLGASDCDCPTHLLRVDGDAHATVQWVHDQHVHDRV